MLRTSNFAFDVHLLMLCGIFGRGTQFCAVLILMITSFFPFSFSCLLFAHSRDAYSGLFSLCAVCVPLWGINFVISILLKCILSCILLLQLTFCSLLQSLFSLGWENKPSGATRLLYLKKHYLKFTAARHTCSRSTAR